MSQINRQHNSKQGSSLRLKHRERFDYYLQKYAALPLTKKVISGMIKFENMYKPISKGSLFVDAFGHLQEINRQRRVKRLKVYLNRRDLINTFDQKHGKRLVVSSRGHKIFYKDYPLAKLRKKKWDGVWTLVMYDFPEKERVQRCMIRRKLMRFGFGSPQLSILISPLPVEEPVQQLLEGEGVADKVWTLRANRVLGLDNREIARIAWPIIDELKMLYQELLDALPQVQGKSHLEDGWKSYFLALNSADPYLPLELLPDDWKGGECEKAYIKLSRKGFLRVLFKFWEL